MRPLLLVLTLAGLLAPSQPVAAEPTSKRQGPLLAVLEFRDQSGRLDQNFVALLADEARGNAVQIVGGLGIRVMDRANMTLLIRDMGKGATCSEGECDVETGRNIGASHILTGEIVPDGSRYHLSMQLHETRHGDLKAHARRESSDKGGLFEAVQSATGALLRETFGAGAAGTSAAGGAAAAEFSETQQLNPAARRYLVAFSSTPSGATVRVDGSQVCDATPCSRNLSGGMHQVVIEKSRYEALKRQLLVGDSVRSLDGQLRPLFGSVTVRLSEPGVQVFLDGGSSPTMSAELDPGPHYAEIRDKCYLGQKRPFDIKAGETTPLQLEVKRRMIPASVDATLGGNAATATIEVDGVSIGSTPFDGHIWACAKGLAVRHADLPAWQETLDPGGSKAVSITADLDQIKRRVDDERLQAEEAERVRREEEARPKLKPFMWYGAVGSSRFRDYHLLMGMSGGKTVRFGAELDVVLGVPVGVRSGLDETPVGVGFNLLLERTFGGHGVFGVSSGAGMAMVSCKESSTTACSQFLPPSTDGSYDVNSWYWSSSAYLGYYGERFIVRGGAAYVVYGFDKSLVDMGGPLGLWILLGIAM